MVALSTFIYYNDNFPDGARITNFIDGSEGVVQWFDLIGSLSAVYHEQINTVQDQHEAIIYLVRNHREDTWLGGALDVPNGFGANFESYYIGAMATVLIDMHMERFEWQQLFEKYHTHPFEILLNIFYEYEFPKFESEFLQVEADIVYGLRKNSKMNMQNFLDLLKITLSIDAIDIDQVIQYIEDDAILAFIEEEGENLRERLLLYSIPLTKYTAKQIIYNFTNIRITFEYYSENEDYITFDEAFYIMESRR